MSKQRDFFQFATMFWGKVERGAGDACWPWRGTRNVRGYGQLGWTDPSTKERGHLTAHRVAYHLTHGAPPVGMCVMHTCDNPPCCNPAHLKTGTVADNNRDRSIKGRTARPGVGNWRKPRYHGLVGSKHPNTKLTDDQVRQIKAMCRARAFTQRQIGAMFGVSQSTVMTIATGRAWTHIE